MSLLVGHEIGRSGIVHVAPGESPPEFHGSSADLRIGQIVLTTGAMIDDDMFVLQPQHVVLVISKEIVALPNDVTGFFTVKSALAFSGLQVITPSLVDPLWVGPLSAVFINFGKEPILLRSGDGFARMTFQRHNAVSGRSLMQSYDPARHTEIYDNYSLSIRQRFVTKFSETFLNLRKNVDEVRTLLVDDYRRITRDYGALGLAAFGILVGVFAIVIPVVLDRMFFRGDEISSQQVLLQRIELLERRLEAEAPKPNVDVTPPAPAPDSRPRP